MHLDDASLVLWCNSGGNLSHVVVLRPYSYGYKTSGAAKVTYKQGVGEAEVQVAYSNDLGLVPNPSTG